MSRATDHAFPRTPVAGTYAALLFLACLLILPTAHPSSAADLEPLATSAAQDEPPAETQAKPKLVHRREDLFESDESPMLALGRRLFTDPLLGASAACTLCHRPPERHRNYADSRPRSPLPHVKESAVESATTMRNTPTLLDAAQGDRFNHDGAFDSLEDLIKAKLVSPDMGRAAEDVQAVSETIRAALLREDQLGWTYAEAFSTAYAVDIEASSPQEAVGQVARALAEFVSELKSTRTAPYDAFGYVNRIEEAVGPGTDPKDFAGRIFGRLGNLEGRVLVKLVAGFNELEYQGLKIFFATEGVRGVGNCVACHYPPYFTDFAFHNTGVSQEAYDALHGEGRFAALDIPSASNVSRPSRDFRARPITEDPAKVDLGHWNFADIQKTAPPNPLEPGELFLEQMISTFKTPSLRNLNSTDPYMHNGGYETIEDVLAQKIRASALAKAGKLRGADDELKSMYITQDDIPALAAFLRALNEVPPENFRNLIVKGITIRPVHPM